MCPSFLFLEPELVRTISSVSVLWLRRKTRRTREKETKRNRKKKRRLHLPTRRYLVSIAFSLFPSISFHPRERRWKERNECNERTSSSPIFRNLLDLSSSESVRSLYFVTNSGIRQSRNKTAVVVQWVSKGMINIEFLTKRENVFARSIKLSMTWRRLF